MNWKKLLKISLREKLIFIIILILISFVSYNWTMFDYTASDGPKGIGFPFAFYIGGGGLCFDTTTKQPITCQFIFDYKMFIVDFIIWLVISFGLAFSSIRVYNKVKKK